MNDCKCTRDGDISSLQVKVMQLESNDREIKAKIKETDDNLKSIEKVTVDIAVFAQQLVTLTDEIKSIKTEVVEIRRFPPDYHRVKRIADNVDHYKKVAIGSVLLAIIGAFLVGLKISL